FSRCRRIVDVRDPAIPDLDIGRSDELADVDHRMSARIGWWRVVDVMPLISENMAADLVRKAGEIEADAIFVQEIPGISQFVRVICKTWILRCGPGRPHKNLLLSIPKDLD